MQHTTVEIMGGLGNQLFQIFALLAYALKYKTPFYFPAEPIHHGQRKRTYWETPLLQSLRPFVKKSNQTPPPPQIPPEKGLHYQTLPYYEQAHGKTFGHFQSLKNFEDQKAKHSQPNSFKKNQSLLKSKNKNN